mgnify:CR=1 FL=1
MAGNIGQLEQYDRFLRRKRLALLAAGLLTAAALLVSLGVGSMRLSLGEIVQALLRTGEQKHQTVLWNVRLPRAAAAVLVGAVLASSGAVMQCVLRSPLASASTLGISQGAAFGAAVGIIVFGGGVVTSAAASATVAVNNPYIVTLCAFLCGALSSVVVLAISRLKRSIGPGGLILAGTALSAMFSGGSTLLQYFSDDSALGAVVFWTFGNLGNANWKELGFLTAVFAASFLFYLFHRWNYNAMEVGADTAQSLGVDTRRVMQASMVVYTLSTAAAVSLVGIISFVGLIAPHIMRVFVGGDHRYLIPGSALAGALLLLLADLLARVAMPPVILPIGALMSFVGGPMFLFLLFKERGAHG